MTNNTKTSQAKKISPIDKPVVIQTLKSTSGPYEPFTTPYKLNDIVGVLSALWEDEDEL